MQLREIYFISGLGADRRVFTRLQLSGFNINFINWEIPIDNEEFGAYCSRLIPQINLDKPVILLGVSFGGMVAQEIAKIIPCQKVIILSSIKSETEMPFSLKAVKLTKVYKIFHPKVLKFLNLISAWYYFSISDREELKMLKQIIKDTDIRFMVWAIDKIMNWDNVGFETQNLVHIHGTKDRIFPIGCLNGCIPVFGGTHFMVYNKAELISNLILQELN